MDSLTLIQSFISIVILDLVLSGDNAVVIGMAAHRLPPAQRKRAIIIGAGGAILLRIIFTIAAALLLAVPLVEGVGGVLLLWIAYTLVRQEEDAQHKVRSGDTLFIAIRTIIMADVVMSLDNILAVGGSAHGNVPLLIFGLLLSMTLLMFGSNLVAGLMARYSWLVYLGAAILIYTAIGMIFHDPLIGPHLPQHNVFEGLFTISLIILIIGGTIWSTRRHQHTAESAPTKPGTETP